MVDAIAPHREGLRGLPEIDALPGNQNPPSIAIDPLVQLKILGDDYPGNRAQGRTMRGGPSVDRFKFACQDIKNEGELTCVVTTLTADDGCRVEHLLSWYAGDRAFCITTRFVNESKSLVTLEMLGSFSLGAITPFDKADAEGRLQVHRFRSAWSAEARLETQSIEALHLERSWTGSGTFSERFGQIGSMPTRGWFPFVAVEDTVAGVVWGAQLAWGGSWQMEIFRQHDDVSISGGLADREFGHWTKHVGPGEVLETPKAILSCVKGDLDALCDRLTAFHDRAVNAHPAIEQDLPIIFNEYCTTWGEPSHDKLVAIADRLKETEVKYLVIDAGWYEVEGLGRGHGDWIPSTKLFPNGLERTVAALRERGLETGLWFEMENVSKTSAAWNRVNLLLKRDGIPITVRNRRFFDLNDPAVIEYLTDRFINLLDRCGFGYLKVDYNETIGFGCDGFESPGEGLRRQTLGTYRLFDLIRQRLPNLVIENCASGGNRLEPSMLARTAMSSFSDAHELVEIPIIAANLHRLMLPRQSQIWAVLHTTDSDQRLIYSLAATFLGRMCLSGEIVGLSATQWRIVKSAMALYREAAPVIKCGISRKCGTIGASWRHPKGWQSLVRTSMDGRTALVVMHAFNENENTLYLPLPNGKWGLGSTLILPTMSATVVGSALKVEGIKPFIGLVLILHQC